MTEQKELTIYILSDSMGETAQYVARAATSQFPQLICQYRHIPFVEDEKYIAGVLEAVEAHNGLLVFTLAVPTLRAFVRTFCDTRGIRYVDVLHQPLSILESYVGSPPKGRPGTVQRMDDTYFQKISAIEFAIKYDDGKDLKGLRLADLILIGVSRTSKSPLSMYMAYRGIKVANVPLVSKVKGDDYLYEVPKEKFIGLTIQPQVLHQIRQERMKGLGVRGQTDYADMAYILDELDHADKVMKRLGCPVLDVSHKAIEETATSILQIYYSRGDNVIE